MEQGSIMPPPRVAVWRDYWLPPSETFILNQADAYTAWLPTLCGIRETNATALGNSKVITLASNDLQEKIARLSLRIPSIDPWLRRKMGRPHIVHSHFGPDSATIMRAADAIGARRVITFHGYDITTRPEFRADWQMTKLWEPLIDGSGAVIAVSDFIASLLTNAGVPEAKIRVVHTGIPLPNEPAVPPSARESGILFVGRLVEKKGPLPLLRAVAGLPERLRSTRVTMIGDGPLLQQVKAEAERLRLNVTILGSRPFREVEQAMESHSIFCVPSRTSATGDAEGFGMVFLEAAARGMPVVTSRSGGNVDALVDGSTGFITDPVDGLGLTDRLRILLTDGPLADKFAYNGRKFVESGFDIRMKAREIEACYDELIAQEPTVRRSV